MEQRITKQSRRTLRWIDPCLGLSNYDCLRGIVIRETYNGCIVSAKFNDNSLLGFCKITASIGTELFVSAFAMNNNNFYFYTLESIPYEDFIISSDDISIEDISSENNVA